MSDNTNIVAMWDHNGMIHVGEQPCPSMGSGGAGMSFTEFFFMAMNRPEKICPECVARNKAAHDQFLLIMGGAR